MSVKSETKRDELVEDNGGDDDEKNDDEDGVGVGSLCSGGELLAVILSVTSRQTEILRVENAIRIGGKFYLGFDGIEDRCVQRFWRVISKGIKRDINTASQWVVEKAFTGKELAMIWSSLSDMVAMKLD